MEAKCLVDECCENNLVSLVDCKRDTSTHGAVLIGNGIDHPYISTPYSVKATVGALMVVLKKRLPFR